MKLRYILSLLLLPAMFIACDDDDEVINGEKISTSRIMQVPAGAAEYKVMFTADNLSVSSTDTSWCKPVNEKKYVVNLKITQNDSTFQRMATVTVNAGLLTETLSVIQAAKEEEKEEEIPQYDGYTLVWHDEFNVDGAPDPEVWRPEVGFQRNEEVQWYQADNVTCKNGLLVFTAKKERVANPNYEAGSSDWKKKRQYAEYTSSSIVSSYRFRFGRMEVKAKIPTAMGAWPAIWTTGGSNDSWCWEWPLGGEIDLLEYYLVNGKPSIHANVCWGSDTRWSGRWKSYNRPFSTFTAKDPEWADKFHIWRMDWDSESIKLYLDGEILNEVNLANTTNGTGGFDDWWRGSRRNPFTDPGNDGEGFGQQIFLNLALGGNGGTPDNSKFPLEYLVDYVRIYQKTDE